MWGGGVVIMWPTDLNKRLLPKAITGTNNDEAAAGQGSEETSRPQRLVAWRVVSRCGGVAAERPGPVAGLVYSLASTIGAGGSAEAADSSSCTGDHSSASTRPAVPARTALAMGASAAPPSSP